MPIKSVVLIVAHPDDETLWCGGTMLNHPRWQWFVLCLCRKNDRDRAPRFFKALKRLHATGVIANLDDGPTQTPLPNALLEQTILDLLPATAFDMVITHDPEGEYTRHLRHEEIGKTVLRLWKAGKIPAAQLWTFAYEDGEKKYYPLAVNNASIYMPLKDTTWQKKYDIITRTYGFDKTSWEARTTPLAEAFWKHQKGALPEHEKTNL